MKAIFIFSVAYSSLICVGALVDVVSQTLVWHCAFYVVAMHWSWCMQDWSYSAVYWRFWGQREIICPCSRVVQVNDAVSHVCYRMIWSHGCSQEVGDACNILNKAQLLCDGSVCLYSVLDNAIKPRPFLIAKNIQVKRKVSLLFHITFVNALVYCN